MVLAPTAEDGVVRTQDCEQFKRRNAQNAPELVWSGFFDRSMPYMGCRRPKTPEPVSTIVEGCGAGADTAVAGRSVIRWKAFRGWPSR